MKLHLADLALPFKVPSIDDVALFWPAVREGEDAGAEIEAETEFAYSD